MTNLHNFIKAEGNKTKFSKGQTIFSSDSMSICLIDEGFIKRYQITNNGSLSIQSIYGAGSVFPLTAVFKLLFNQSIYAGPETHFYEAVVDTTIYFIESEKFKLAVEADPLLYRGLLVESGKRFFSNIQKIENMSLANSTKRVAHQLLYFANEFGERSGKGSKILLPLTHQMLADALSLTRETVSQSIGELRGMGLIKTNKSMVVPDIEKLKQEAYS